MSCGQCAVRNLPEVPVRKLVRRRVQARGLTCAGELGGCGVGVLGAVVLSVSARGSGSSSIIGDLAALAGGLQAVPLP